MTTSHFRNFRIAFIRVMILSTVCVCGTSCGYKEKASNRENLKSKLNALAPQANILKSGKIDPLDNSSKTVFGDEQTTPPASATSDQPFSSMLSGFQLKNSLDFGLSSAPMECSQAQADGIIGDARCLAFHLE